MIYLLHFEAEISGKLHYCGSTDAARFDKRMLEHQKGYGSVLTRRLVNNGKGFYLARTWLVSNRDKEHALKRNGHVKAGCPICRRSLEPALTTCKLYPSLACEPTPERTLNWSRLGQQHRF